MKKKILERESREKIERKKSLYPSNETIMIEIIRDHIKVTQYRLTVIDVINFEYGSDQDLIYCMNFGAISSHHIFISSLS